MSDEVTRTKDSKRFEICQMGIWRAVHDRRTKKRHNTETSDRLSTKYFRGNIVHNVFSSILNENANLEIKKYEGTTQARQA